MDSSSSSESIGGTLVTVENSLGKATFVRKHSQLASLNIEYEMPTFAEEKEGKSLEEVVEKICQDEIQLMKQTLFGLATLLTDRVSNAGEDPRIDRNWKARDERDWNVTDKLFLVGFSETRLRESFRGYEGTSDARLVQETIRLMIEQRELNIRAVYQNVLRDASTNQSMGPKRSKPQ